MTGLRSLLVPVLLCAVCAGSGGLIGYVVAPRIDAPPRDFLDDCYAADRASRVRILRECEEREFASDTAKADWINKEIDAARETDFAEFSKQAGKAIASKTATDLAGRLTR